MEDERKEFASARSEVEAEAPGVVSEVSQSGSGSASSVNAEAVAKAAALEKNCKELEVAAASKCDQLVAAEATNTTLAEDVRKLQVSLDETKEAVDHIMHYFLCFRKPQCKGYMPPPHCSPMHTNQASRSRICSNSLPAVHLCV